MPISVIDTNAVDLLYPSPFIQGVEHTQHVKVNVPTLTAFEVDARGFLKPGVPLKIDTVGLATAGGDQVAMTIEPIKVAAGNSAAQLTAAALPFVACATMAQANLDVIEDILGRFLTAGELAAIRGAGSRISLTTT